MGAEPSTAFDCLVAVTEACTNALIHGRRDLASADPRIGWDIVDEEARFWVQDFSANPWDWTAPPRETYAFDLEARYGGFGLRLMRELMDRVDISSTPEGTAVRLMKKLRP